MHVLGLGDHLGEFGALLLQRGRHLRHRVRGVDDRLHVDAGRGALTSRCRQLSEKRVRCREHLRVDHLLNRVQLDQDVFDVPLETHVVATLEFDGREDVRVFEQRLRVIR